MTGILSNNYDAAFKYNCPLDFGVTYIPEKPLRLLEPWDYASVEAGKSGNTGWKGNEPTFSEISYARQGSETAEDYVGRIFGVAGRCTGGADSSNPKLCWQGWARNIIPVDPAEFCTGGDGCEYHCATIVREIKKGFNETVRKVRVRNNLEVEIGEVENKFGQLKGNLSSSRSDAEAVQAGKVGEILKEARTIECNSNCHFVRIIFDNVKEELCVNAIDNLTYVWLALVILASLAILNGGFAMLLVVRMKGDSKVDVEPTFEEDMDEEDNGKGLGSEIDLYA